MRTGNSNTTSAVAAPDSFRRRRPRITYGPPGATVGVGDSMLVFTSLPLLVTAVRMIPPTVRAATESSAVMITVSVVIPRWLVRVVPVQVLSCMARYLSANDGDV